MRIVFEMPSTYEVKSNVTILEKSEIVRGSINVTGIRGYINSGSNVKLRVCYRESCYAGL